MRTLILLALASCAWAQPTIHIFEVDNITQTNRVITMGMYFKDGDIANCAVPVISGTPLDTSHYQCDVKTRYGSGSLKQAVISFITTLTALQNLAVTFQSGACNNSGQLTQSQMVHFNSDGWGAQMVTTVGGVSQTVDSVTMLNALTDNTYCQIEYDQQGPIVTKVRVQDCTSAFAYDFGGSWGAPIATVSVANNGGSGCNTGNTVTFPNETGTGATITANVSGGVIASYTVTAGGTGFVGTRTITVAQSTCTSPPTATYTVGSNVMTLNSGAWYTGTSKFAALHPQFDLSFYPSTNTVQVEFDLQNEWISKNQDQKFDSLVLKTGAAHTSVWNSSSSLYPSGYIFYSREHIRKTFWSGTSPGHIRIDWNFPYLISTGLLPNYDLTSKVTSVVPAGVLSGPYGISYTDYAGNDHGDVGGTGGLTIDFANNSENASVQMEPLRYLYLMSTANTLAAARAWAVLTGEVDTQAGLVGVSGGAGLWNEAMNLPIHLRDDRPSNAEGGYTATGYYSANYAGIDAVPGTTTAGSTTGAYLGRGFSKHAWINDNTGVGGIAAYPGINYGSGAHSALSYINNGGNYWTAGSSPGDCSHMQEYSFLPYILLGNRLFLDDLNRTADICISNATTFINSSSAGFASIRQFAATLQLTQAAATANPDGTPEQLYYTAATKGALSMMEGFLGITGTSLTPAVYSAACSGYTVNVANRWMEGRCNIYLGTNVTHTLHSLAHGACPIGGDAAGILDNTKATNFIENYFQVEAQGVMGYLIRLGMPNATASFQESSKQLIEMVQDPTFNPFYIGTELMGNSNGTCGSQISTPLFTTWAQVGTAYKAPYSNPTSMGSCDGKDYSLTARAAATYAMNVTDGSYNGTATYNWISTNLPQYFSSSCTTAYNDQQLRFAILPPVIATFSGLSGGNTKFGGAAVAH